MLKSFFLLVAPVKVAPQRTNLFDYTHNLGQVLRRMPFRTQQSYFSNHLGSMGYGNHQRWGLNPDLYYNMMFAQCPNHSLLVYNALLCIQEGMYPIPRNLLQKAGPQSIVRSAHARITDYLESLTNMYLDCLRKPEYSD